MGLPSATFTRLQHQQPQPPALFTLEEPALMPGKYHYNTKCLNPGFEPDKTGEENDNPQCVFGMTDLQEYILYAAELERNVVKFWRWSRW